jgi:photosystem II stability/assembly factor-like uncharacterized protein
MKSIIFASFLFCLAATTQAQQTDSIVTSPWAQVRTPGSFVALGYISPDTCWASGDTSNLLSTDGGNTWRPHTGYVFTMRNAHEGFGFDGPLILKTYNAWQTWDSVSDPLTQNPTLSANTLVIVDSLHVFLGGWQGGNAIAYSSDGGNTWDYAYLGTFGGFDFADDKVGYAVGGGQQGPQPGEQGTGAFKTANGGVSWTQLYPGGSGLLNNAWDVVAIDENTAIMVGDNLGGNSLIARTTDGGNTWQRISSPLGSNAEYQHISIQGAIGYISGIPGVILRTTDTGKTWTAEQSGRSGELGKPFIYGDSLAAIAADSGIILIRNGSLASVSQQQSDSLSIGVFPNPSQSLVTLSYMLFSPQIVTLTLFDINGNIIASLLNAVLQNAGNQSVSISTSNLSSGTYFYRFSSQNYSSSGSFIVNQ